MRDRLIELLSDTLSKYNLTEHIADYLIAHGVIVPPCKVGDTVFAILYAPISQKYYVTEKEVLNVKCINGVWYVDINSGGKTFTFQIGEKAFLTREEAEQALKGGVE